MKPPYRKIYNFHKMIVDENNPKKVKCETSNDVRKARSAVHNTGYRHGWMFRTQLIGDMLLVWRVS